jgi:hypothetical protein
MLLCTFAFLVTLTSWGIHTKNILKIHNIFIIVSFDKSSHRLKVVSRHPFFNCTIVVVSMCFNHYYAIIVVLLCLHFNCAIVIVFVLSFQLCHCYCFSAFISIVPTLLCHHCCAFILSCFHHYYTIVIVLEFLQLLAFTMCEIMKN